MTFTRSEMFRQSNERAVIQSSRLITLIIFYLCCAYLQAAVTLDEISYSSMPGDRVQIDLKFSEPLTDEPVNFTIDNPARIAVDLPGVSLNLAERNQSIGIGMAHSLAAVEAGGRTRVVVNLVRPVSYEMTSQGNTVRVTLGSGVSAASGAAVAAAALAGPRASSGASSEIDKIDFQRGDGGEGRIIVTLSDPSVGVNMGQESGQIVVDFLSTNLPTELDRRLDVVDFATPVKEIDTSTYAGGSRMLISTVTDQFDHMAYQSGNVFTIEVRPLSQEEKQAQAKEKFGFTGERLSLNFQNIEVRAVLQLIADFTGFNLVATDTVTGSVTLRLRNVPWDQVLDIILKAKGLAIRKDGNVMLVAPTEEIAAREKLELESQQQVTELSPLRTEFIQINYAKASDLSALIQGSESNLLSGRGNVSIDDRTNTLIVQDVATSLEAIRNLIAKLDIPIRQVMIESRIVNADETFSKDLGVQFGYTKRSRDAMTNEGIATMGSAAEFDLEPTADNFLVNLPVAGTSGIGFAVGKIGSYLLQLELSALLAEGRGEDIANPKIITANQTEAVIESGVEIPYQEASSSGATSTSFKKAVLSLKVTPQITPDDRIILDLAVNQDSQGATTSEGIPVINTKNVTTQVLVNDGETVVLGGVYTQTDRHDSDRVPFFGDLPYIGFLFKNNRIRNTRNELLIFVTPRILNDDLNI
ncbi:MAG: pilus assembly protein PilQ [Gammaproteobacteria bacterium RIFCSPLOWO2_02_FULL_56_15]|nr:MAG: pilus assembly protein PilQ [Gammaproteobacteria bacterium RIFCSPLOWO2_02_FULL_56_15]